MSRDLLAGRLIRSLRSCFTTWLSKLADAHPGRLGRISITLFHISPGSPSGPLTTWKIIPSHLRDGFDARGRDELMVRSGEAVMEKVRRYRATASLYRQTASFRPLQRWSLLEQAEEWERLAVEELEAYFIARNSRHDDQRSPVAGYAEASWETAIERETNVMSMRAATRFESALALAA